MVGAQQRLTNAGTDFMSSSLLNLGSDGICFSEWAGGRSFSQRLPLLARGDRGTAQTEPQANKLQKSGSRCSARVIPSDVG